MPGLSPGSPRPTPRFDCVGSIWAEIGFNMTSQCLVGAYQTVVVNSPVVTQSDGNVQFTLRSGPILQVLEDVDWL